MPAVKKTEPLPPRKSDGAATTARFVLAEHDPDDDPAFDPPTAPVSTAAPPQPPQPTTNTTTTTPQPKDKDSANGKDKEKDALAIEVGDLGRIVADECACPRDLTLPKSIITRLAKGVLQPNTQIQANAILALSKSATVFINYLAHHANENTLSAGKKTIMPADVFKAVDETEFGFMRAKLEAEFTTGRNTDKHPFPPLRAEFHETNSAKRSSYRKKVAMAKRGGGSSSGAGSGSADVSMMTMDDSVVSNDASMVSGGPAESGRHETAADDDDDNNNNNNSTTSTTGASGPRPKKPKLGPLRKSFGGSGSAAAADHSKMEVDGEQDEEEEGDEEEEVSDAETVPDESQDEEDEEDEEEEEEEDEDEEEQEEDEDDDEAEDQDDDDEDEDMDEEARERRHGRRHYDEALDDRSEED
ncbi:uncharacterized protein MKZ38_008634 [Zalerion maritima]|uniref:DNA polymerase epsilon subunit D n=1 Tax=Zalerion maritima TaxID=339359 RepID=A0AAD5RYH5_9PEZI|nr:uncharacterized protein MKZ38_008634 [Zalerion maritima]